jgi:protein-tyrosine-phosphatase
MNVLFACNGNVARSQEAEAFFNSQNTSADTPILNTGPSQTRNTSQLRSTAKCVMKYS